MNFRKKYMENICEITKKKKKKKKKYSRNFAARKFRKFTETFLTVYIQVVTLQNR